MSTLFSGHYLRNRSTLDIGVLGYIGIVQHKEHSLEVLSIHPGTPCINIYYFSLTSALDRVGGQRHIPAALPPWKDPLPIV